jgi:hypothetical protein
MNTITQLRLRLVEQFDLDGLRTLCQDLAIAYDDVAGETLSAKARELIIFLGQRGRLRDLLEGCARLRAAGRWQELLAAYDLDPAAFRLGPAGEPAIRPLNDGLLALAELMGSAGIQGAVVEFRTDFQAAREQFRILDAYKMVHDLLHRLQFYCLNPLVQEARRFPGDPLALDNVADHELTLRQIFDELRQVALPTDESDWMNDIAAARDRLRQAVAGRDAAPLRAALWQLQRILATQPPQINVRLNTAARNLRLPALRRAMERIEEHLRTQAPDPGRLAQFQGGLDALAALERQLAALVEEHDRWQDLEVELRRVDGSLSQGPLELQYSWPYVRGQATPLYQGRGADVAAAFAEPAAALDAAVAAGDALEMARHFRRFWRLAGDAFFQVDVTLKRLCEQLRQVGEPLSLVLNLLSPPAGGPSR